MYCLAAHCDITPEQPVQLAGFSVRNEPSRAVHSRLEANALLLTDGRRRVLLVTADLLYIGRALREQVLESTGGKLDDAGLFMAASHTHYAPATVRNLPALGEISDGYIDFAARRIGVMVNALLAGEPVPVRVRYGRGTAAHAINRRLQRRGLSLPGARRRDETQMLPNMRGPRDESAHVLRIERADGTPVAVAWSYACHPVSFPDRDQVSAEYPGRVRDGLRAACAEPLPVLFLQGFAGDIRPRMIVRDDSLRGRVRALINRHYWQPFDRARWDDWAGSLADVVTTTVAHAATATAVDGRVSVARTSTEVAWITRAEHATDVVDPAPLTLHRISIGDELHIIGVSAEPVTAYAHRVRGLFRGTVIPVGYIDEVYGYLPTDAMVAEGGYEVDGFRSAFGIAQPFAAGIQERFLASVRGLGHANPAPCPVADTTS